MTAPDDPSATPDRVPDALERRARAMLDQLRAEQASEWRRAGLTATVRTLDDRPDGAPAIEFETYLDQRMPFPVHCGACGQEMLFKYTLRRHRYHHPPVRKSSPYCPLESIFTTWPEHVAEAAYRRVAALDLDPRTDSVRVILERHVERVDVVREGYGAHLRDVFASVLRYA